MKQQFTIAIALIQNTITRLEVFKKEAGVSNDIKYLCRGMIKRLKATLSVVQCNVPNEAWQDIKSQVLNTDSSLQIENLIELVVSLDQKGRDITEEFVNQLKLGRVEAVES